MHWAKRVAFNRVLTFRKQKKRQGIPCSGEFLNAVEEAVASENELFDARARALANCLKKLTDQERQLISLRYENDCTIKDVAAKTGRPANTLYKALGRIRHALLECIERTLSREEQA
jgi:RNA polymerase sigma-70 factor (ECF subfamily)